jgi:putative ABC transport system permease protein
MKLLRLIVRNALRNRRRTILTTLSIGISLCLFAVAMTLPAIANSVLAVNNSSPRIVCFNKASMNYEMPAAYQRRIAAMPHVAGAAAWLWFGGTYRDPNNTFPNFGVDPDQFPVVWPDSQVSKSQLAEFLSDRSACLAGVTTMRNFNFRIGDRVTLRGTYYQTDASCRIVGAVSNAFGLPSNGLWFRRDYLEAVTGSRGFVDFYWVATDSIASIPSVIGALEHTFANSSSELECASEKGFNTTMFENYRMYLWLAEGVSFMVVGVIALVAANTAAMAVRERRREIAVLRSLGFSKAMVAASVVAEFALVGAIGGLLACALGNLAIRAMASSAMLNLIFVSQLPLSVTVLTLLLASALGAFSALVPVVLAVRRNIVDQLRVVD